jgi:4'-phosphopantetheinyl transferase EntD
LFSLTFVKCRQNQKHIFIFTFASSSLKESVYKAMHPILCHYVGFHEAEITPLMDGTAKVSLQLVNNGLNNSSMDIIIHSASWKKIGNDFFLTSASVGTTAHG